MFALLQLITFVCTLAIENISSTTPIVNFSMPYCNCQHFYGTTSFVRTIATIISNATLLPLLTFKCTMVIDRILCTIEIDLLLYALWQLTTFLDYCMSCIELLIVAKICFDINLHKQLTCYILRLSFWHILASFLV